MGVRRRFASCSAQKIQLAGLASSGVASGKSWCGDVRNSGCFVETVSHFGRRDLIRQLDGCPGVHRERSAENAPDSVDALKQQRSGRSKVLDGGRRYTFRFLDPGSLSSQEIRAWGLVSTRAVLLSPPHSQRNFGRSLPFGEENENTVLGRTIHGVPS